MNGERQRDDRGAIAVIFAICALMFFSVAAIGVDLGNAMNRKKQTQTTADFAALAGADGLPTTDDNTRGLVAAYLNRNGTQTDGNDKCDQSPGPVTVADLKDGDPTNGEVTFPSSNEVEVVSPSAKVDFGLANALGFSSTCVQGEATARIGSGAGGMAPYYATSSCDSGIQTLKSNASGLSVPVSVPVLFADGESNTSTLATITPASIPVATLVTDPVVTITLTGTNLDAAMIDQVGVFNSDRTAPAIATIVTQAPTSIQFTVPLSVSSVQDVWYIRVHRSAANPAGLPAAWSKRSEALSLVVGSAMLSCDPDSTTGNFGSLDLPGWKGYAGINSSGEQLAMNIASGLRPPLSLTTYKGLPFPAGECPAEGTTSPTVISENEAQLSANTNCVLTSPGLDTGAATDGFLTGVGSGSNAAPGSLVANTSKACTDPPISRPLRYAGTTAGENLNINDDLLTCFFRSTSTTIANAINYAGTAPLFTQDIFKSPRFQLVPVFSSDPPGSKTYPIKRFVAAFITDQPTGATRANNLEDNTQTDHGLVVTWAGHKPKLGAIRIIFFPIEALPAPPDGTVISDYFGTGAKVITLTN